MVARRGNLERRESRRDVISVVYFYSREGKPDSVGLWGNFSEESFGVSYRGMERNNAKRREQMTDGREEGSEINWTKHGPCASGKEYKETAGLALNSSYLP